MFEIRPLQAITPALSKVVGMVGGNPLATQVVAEEVLQAAAQVVAMAVRQVAARIQGAMNLENIFGRLMTAEKLISSNSGIGK